MSLMRRVTHHVYVVIALPLFAASVLIELTARIAGDLLETIERGLEEK